MLLESGRKQQCFEVNPNANANIFMIKHFINHVHHLTMLACYHFLINLIGKVQLKDIHSYLCWWTISVQTNLFGRINIRVLHHYKLLNYLNNYMLWTIYLVALESHDWYHCHDCVAVICLVERLKQREICLIMFEEVYASHRQNKKNLLLSLLKNRLFSEEGQCGDFDGRKIKTRVSPVWLNTEPVRADWVASGQCVPA